jgi:hypothetical protein
MMRIRANPIVTTRTGSLARAESVSVPAAEIYAQLKALGPMCSMMDVRRESSLSDDLDFRWMEGKMRGRCTDTSAHFEHEVRAYD